MEPTILRKHLPTSITSSPTMSKGSKLKISSSNDSSTDLQSCTTNNSNFSTTSEDNAIPSVAELKPFAQKCGRLKKLSGRNIWNVGTWRDRYCLLVKNKLYYFENEESQGTEKSAGFVNLNDFTTCSSPEVTTRLTKKVINVFVVGTSETKSFFESNRDYYFAAETLEDRNEWMAVINERMRHHLSIKNKAAASTSSPDESKRRQKAQTGTPTAKRHEEETPTSHQRKSAATISSDAVNLSSMLKSPKAERSLSIFQDGNRKKMMSGSTPGDNALTMSSLPSSPTGQQLDFSVTKGRAKGPPGRRLPRKSSPYKDISSSNSQSDLLQEESGTPNRNDNIDDQLAAALSRSHRAKSLCLLDDADPGTGTPAAAGRDNSQSPNSRTETIEMKSCRKNANALKRLSAAISLSNANPTAAVVGGNYDSSKDEYWNGANNTKSIDLIDLDYSEAMGKHGPSQDNARKNPSIELKRKSISIMPYSSGSSSSSNEEVDNAGLEQNESARAFNMALAQGNTRASCGRGEKIISQNRASPVAVFHGHTKTNAQKPAAEVPRRGKCVSGGAQVAVGEEPGFKNGQPGHNGNATGTSTPILRRYQQRDSGSMTPSPCVLRKLREAILSANKNANNGNYQMDEEYDSQDDTITMNDSNPESPFSTVTRSSHRARNLSGPSTSSSLSTLTPFSGIGKSDHKSVVAGVDQHVTYSSLHRPSTPKQVYNGGTIHPQYLKSCLSTNHSRGYSSASASPLLNGQNGGHRRLAGLANSNSAQGTDHPYVGNGSGNDLTTLNISFMDRTLETLKHEIGAAKIEAKQLHTDMGSLRQDVGNLAESIISVHKTLVDTQDKMGQLGAQVNNIERQINTIVKETNIIRNHAEKLVESAEASKLNYNLLEEEAKNLVGYLKDVVLHYSALCNCCTSGDAKPMEIQTKHGADSKHEQSYRKMTICESNQAARKNFFNDCLKDAPNAMMCANEKHEDIIEYPIGN